MREKSLLTYYQNNQINPVPLDIEEEEKWEVHFSKRRNLYELHLGIPFSLLRDRSVLEFGCNSGENALILAYFGADLTLVEPNNQVHPRLLSLFEKFGLKDRVKNLVEEQVEDYKSTELYDLVICECFINHLEDRDGVAKKIVDSIAPGGLGVISFDCLYGHFLEMVRKLVFHRACRISDIKDMHSRESFSLTEKLFLDDFSILNASRPLSAWWHDVLLNPFVAWKELWTYHELLPIIEAAGGEFMSSSPSWDSLDQFAWYKNVVDAETRHKALLNEWYSHFTYFITGHYTDKRDPVSSEVVEAVSGLIKSISDYIEGGNCGIDSVTYPAALNDYLAESSDEKITQLNRELASLFAALSASRLEDILSAYHRSNTLRGLWGTTCHYFSFRKVG
jgi:SAM-dependent methyltransferase